MQLTFTNRISWVYHQTKFNGETPVFEDLGNVEYLYIAITLLSILTQSDIICKCPIYRSNRYVKKYLYLIGILMPYDCKLFVLK